MSVRTADWRAKWSGRSRRSGGQGSGRSGRLLPGALGSEDTEAGPLEVQPTLEAKQWGMLQTLEAESQDMDRFRR